MPRGVAKAKDGGVDKGDGKKVGKKDDKVVGKVIGKVVGKGVVKRSRKMRGGDDNFNNYCNNFIMKYYSVFVNAKVHIIETFKKLKVQMQDSDEKSALERILKKETKYIIDAIDNDELTNLLAYISRNEKKIKDIINDDEDIIDRLCKDILFIKIYKLFTEFLDISTGVTKIFSIQIATKKEDDIQKDREAHTRQSSIKDNGSERTLYQPKEQPNPNGIFSAYEERGLLQETETNSVYGKWLDRETIKDRQYKQSRRPSNRTLQLNRVSAQQQRDLGVIQENPTSDSEDKEDIGKILKDSIADELSKNLLNKEETQAVLEKVYKEFINTAEFKRIEGIKNKLKTNIVQKGVVIRIIDDLITTTYNKVIEIIKQQNIRDGSIDVLIEIIQGQAKELNDVENIVRQYITSSTMNEEDKKLIKDAGELAKITNSIYISILEKHIGFLDNLKPKKIRGDITPEGTEEEEETEILDTQDGNQETDVQQVEHIGIRAFPATSQEALSLSSSNSLNSLPAITDSVKKSYGKLLKDQYNRIKSELKKKIDNHIILYKAANDQLITGDERELKIKLKKFIIIAEELFIKSIRKAFEILYENNNSEEILVIYENYAPNKAEFISNVNSTYKTYLIKYRLIGVRAEEIIAKIFADIIDFGVGFHLFCYNMLKKAFKDEKIIWSVSGGKLRKQRMNQQKEPTKTHKANEPPTKKPKANEPINKPTKIPKQKKPTKDPKPTAKKPTKK